MSSKLESDVCYCVYGWRHLVKAMDVTAGLSESNGSLPLGGWHKVTCGLTAYTPDQLWTPMFGIDIRLPSQSQICYRYQNILHGEW